MYLTYAPTYTAGTGIGISASNVVSLLPLTQGTGIIISSTNTVTATGYNSAYWTGTNYNAMYLTYAPTYTAGTGIGISASNVISNLNLSLSSLTANYPLSLSSSYKMMLDYGTGLGLSGFNLVNLNKSGTTYTAGNGIDISVSNVISNLNVSLATLSNTFPIGLSNYIISLFTSTTTTTTTTTSTTTSTMAYYPVYTAGNGIYISPSNVISNLNVTGGGGSNTIITKIYANWWWDN